MLNKATTLQGHTLQCLDGELGMVKEFYFDDHHWTIRYLVADTGNWLTGRRVLISPYALEAVNREDKHIGIGLTMNQIEDSPSLSSDKPVSRQFEETYYGYYGWPIYWGGPYMWGAGYYPFVMDEAGQGPASDQVVSPYVFGASPTAVPGPEVSGAIVGDERTSDPHLRSTHDVRGHRIHATDGEVGHVEDFLIDDVTWAIRYLIIDTQNWWQGRKVLISPAWIERVSWDEKAVSVNLSCETIKQSPEYTADALLTPDHETKLHAYYNRQGYWVDQPVARRVPVEAD